MLASADPVLINVLTKWVDAIDNKIKGKALTLEISGQSPTPLKKILSQKYK